MSNPLSTFIMQGSGIVVKAQEEGEALVQPHHPQPPQPPPPPNPTLYPTFLPPTASSAAPTTTTFLAGPPDTFLTLPEQVEGEGEELLGSGEGEGEGEGVSQGSLLYLDPTTSALHVLVHHLPQPNHHQPTPPQLVEEEGSQEQFVVVGALKTEEDLGSPAPPTTCHVSVEGYLEDNLATEGGETEIYLPHTQDPTPAPPQHLPSTPMLTLVGSGGDGGGEEAAATGRGANITLNQVPHITLEEIIKKFASSPDSPINDISDPTTTTTTIALIPPASPPPSSLSKLTPIVPSTSLSSRVKVKLMPEPSKDAGVVEGEDEGDEGCLYEEVMTYRCKACGEMYDDKAHLLQHHRMRHKQGSAVLIRVTTSDTPTTNAITVNPRHSLQPFQPWLEKERKVVRILSCRYCPKDFLGLREYKEHVSKEHPGKRLREEAPRHYTPHGSPVRYPSQPGILIGHRKSRSPGQGEATGTGGGADSGEEEGDEAESKRKVKAPRVLQDQYWLQKQRPKPVCSVEVEKKLKCSVSTCKYKFSSEANLQAHKDCHGGGGGRLDERGFTCTHCGLRCDKWSACQLHLWKEHGQDVDMLTCGICHTYKTGTLQRLLVHQKIHSDDRDHVCNVCGKGFKQLAQLLNHQVLHVTNPKDMPSWANRAYCEECQTWYKDKKSLRTHNAVKHLKVKPHACPHCSYRSGRKYELTVHMRQHNGERPHRCPICGWQASDHNTMRRHTLGHHDAKPLHCPDPDCAFKTRHQTYFKRHVAKQHPNNEAVFKCQFCPLQTPSIQDYITHSMKHEKDLLEQKLKQTRELALENAADNITPLGEQGQTPPLTSTTAVPTVTTTTTTTTSPTIIKTKSNAMKQHLSTPIVINPQVEVITIKFDSGGEDGKAGDGGGGNVGVGDGIAIGEGETEPVPLPQVVMSENSGNYIIGLSEFHPAATPTSMENGSAGCHIITTSPHHHIAPTSMENGVGGCHVLTTPPHHIRQDQEHPHTLNLTPQPPSSSLELHPHSASSSGNISIT